MITFEEARQLVSEDPFMLPTEIIALQGSLGRYTAAHIISPHHHPRYTNSAVDGYALGSLQLDEAFKIVGEVAAGEVWTKSISANECIRIFTGAEVPEVAVVVVMQEKCERSGNMLEVKDTELRPKANMRVQGEEIRTGDQVLEKGSFITASVVGLLASLGVQQVKVSKAPRVGVLISGGEFTDPADPKKGKIFNSNGPMLHAVLDREGINDMTMMQVEDDPLKLQIALQELLLKTDVIITTGGVSVGDHDHVPALVAELGLDIHFHKVAQKPGKPMLFATGKNKVFFGLPGNPRAVMMGYWMYVLPCLRQLQGATIGDLRIDQFPISQDLQLHGDRTELLAGKVEAGQVKILGGQNSHMLHSLTEADVIVVIPSEKRSLKKGELVTTHWIPR